MSLIARTSLAGQPADFDVSLRSVLGIEGGYADDPADRGGKTRFGITEAVARKHGYRGPMRDLPLDIAIRIYRADYWTPFRFDEIPSLLVTTFLFDMTVNHGAGNMARIAQSALLKRVRIVRDGRWGPQTRGACAALVRQGYELNLLGALVEERGDFFDWIAEKNASQQRFLWGWMKRLVP